MMHIPPKETEYSQLQIHFKIFRKKKMSPEHRLVVFSGFSKILTVNLFLNLCELVIDSSEISLKWKGQFL